MKILALIFALAMAITTSAQQTVLGTAYPCQTVPNATWTNIAFPAQTGNFELQFDASTSVAAANMVLNIGPASTTSFSTTAINSRFWTTGVFQALNGATYAAVSSFPYVATTKYHVTMDVNMGARTFNLYIGVGAARTTIATNYAFHTANTPSSLGYLTAYQAAASPATGQVCNLAVLTYPTTTVTHQVNLKWNAATLPTGATAVSSYKVFKGTTTTGPWTAISSTSPTTLNYIDPNVTAGGKPCYTVEAINSAGPSANATPACTTIP